MAVVLKIRFGSDLRRISLATKPSLRDLRGLLDMLFVTSLPAEYALKYQDEDGDLVSITSDLELNEAFSGGSNNNDNNRCLLRLSIVPVYGGRHQQHQQQSSANLERGRQPPLPAPCLELLACLSALFGRSDLTRLLASLHAGPHSLLADPFPREASAPAAPEPKEERDCCSQSAPDGAEATARHAAICDHCDSRIVGARYKCAMCRDYDLCEKCEARHPSVHDPKHVFLKLRRPLSSRGSSSIPQLPDLYAEAPKCSTAAAATTSTSTRRGVPPRNGSQTRGVAPSMGTSMLMSRFVSDVTIADGTLVAPGLRLRKIWRLQNNGRVAWPADTRLQFVTGDRLSQVDAVAVPPLQPGEHVDVAVDLVAPAREGRFVSHWRLRTNSCAGFGHRVWVDIAVAPPKTPQRASPAGGGKTPAAPSSSSSDDASPSSASSPLVGATCSAHPAEGVNKRESPEGARNDDGGDGVAAPSCSSAGRASATAAPIEGGKIKRRVTPLVRIPNKKGPEQANAEKAQQQEGPPHEAREEEKGKYEEPLAMLAEMGFSDRQVNLQVLAKHEGNLVAAVLDLLSP